MKFFQVNPEFDQHKLYKGVNAWINQTLIGNELLTSSELSKYGISLEFKQNAFIEREIPKTQTHWFFGCRFPSGEYRKFGTCVDKRTA